jgi:N-acyl-D-amino-acid deacylase
MGFIDGAVGFSTAPSLVEDTVDPVLQAFLDRAARRDRTVAVSTRERDDGTLSRVFDAAGDAGVSVHLGELAAGAARRPADPGDLLARASDAGVDSTGDLTPYDTETVMLVSLLPRKVVDESGETFQAALEDADVRDRLRDDLPTAVDWSRVRVTGPPDVAGSTVAELASDRETTVADLVCNLLANDLEATVVVPTADRDALDRSVADERITVATGGALVSTRARRAHGTFAAFLSTGRRRADIGLEEAVRRVTSLPARTFGLDGKGTVTPGADADLVVVDPDRVADLTTETEPRRPPAGVETVLVGGTRALDEGELTGERPGEPIRVSTDG